MNKKGTIFIVSGPSGSGKSTVLHEVFLRRDNMWFSVSATTRAPRPGEEDGKDYFFIPKENFLSMVDDDQFLEHAEYAGNCYGTPKGPIMEHVEAGFDVVLDIEVVGAGQVKEKLPEAVSVFILPPSLEELERRLRKRSTESEEAIIRRLDASKREIAQKDKYDYVLVNEDYRQTAGMFIDLMEKVKLD